MPKIKITAFLAWHVFTFSRKNDKCKEKVDKLEQEKQGMLKGLDYAEGKAVELQEKVLDLENWCRCTTTGQRRRAPWRQSTLFALPGRLRLICKFFLFIIRGKARAKENTYRWVSV